MPVIPEEMLRLLHRCTIWNGQVILEVHKGKYVGFQLLERGKFDGDDHPFPLLAPLPAPCMRTKTGMLDESMLLK